MTPWGMARGSGIESIYMILLYIMCPRTLLGQFWDWNDRASSVPEPPSVPEPWNRGFGTSKWLTSLG